MLTTATRPQLAYQRSVHIDVPPEQAFEFCATRQGFESHFPHRVRAYEGPEQWTLGTHFKMQYRVLGLWMRWHGEIVEWLPGQRFADVMHEGAFKAFRHEHEFEADGAGTRYTDRLTFTLGLGGWLDGLIGLRQVERTFAQRQRLLKSVLEKREAGPR
jgi:ligand-binding SRPBCC domain-containing protein